MPSVKKVTKRRRVSFAEQPSILEPPPDYNNNNSAHADDTVPLADIIRGNAGTPQHSLLELHTDTNSDTNGDGSGNANAATGNAHVTAFDISDDIEDGAALADNDDGVIPVSLQRSVLTEEDNRADFSSDDEYANININMEERPNRRAEPDSWADAMAQMPAAAATSINTANDAGERPSQRRKLADSTTDGSLSLSLAQCVVQLAGILNVEETVTRAMQRLRNARNSNNSNSMDRVTELCSALLEHGVFSAYEMKREDLLGAVKWDLVWSNSLQQRPDTHTKDNVNIDVHGNIEAAMMFAWEEAGYFSKKDRIAWVRPHAAHSIEWQTAQHIFRPSP